MQHLDFQNTYLNAKLEREVYVEFPKYMYSEEYAKRHVMKSKRSLYGLHDAAQIWIELMTGVPSNTMLEPLKRSPCILKEKQIMVICYINDSLQFAKRSGEIDELKNGLRTRFMCKVLGQPAQFFSIELD